MKQLGQRAITMPLPSATGSPTALGTASAGDSARGPVIFTWPSVIIAFGLGLTAVWVGVLVYAFFSLLSYVL